MHLHQPAFHAIPRARRRGRRPVERPEPFFRPREEAIPARIEHDWLGLAVLATALLVGTGLVMLIQLVPALPQALG